MLYGGVIPLLLALLLDLVLGDPQQVPSSCLDGHGDWAAAAPRAALASLVGPTLRRDAGRGWHHSRKHHWHRRGSMDATPPSARVLVGEARAQDDLRLARSRAGGTAGPGRAGRWGAGARQAAGVLASGKSRHRDADALAGSGSDGGIGSGKCLGRDHRAAGVPRPRGLPAALAYRFINTADAMLGYHDAEREWLGKMSARLDDLVNLVPARLAGLLLLATWLLGGPIRRALLVWWRDAGQTASPNAGRL